MTGINNDHNQPSMFLRFCILIYRTFLARLREPTTTYVHTVQTLFLALVVGIIYLRIGDDNDQTSITVSIFVRRSFQLEECLSLILLGSCVCTQDRKGALFFIITNECVDTLLTTIMLFETERLIFIKEHAAGAYGTFLYFLAKNFAELPFLVAFPSLFSVISYWMV